MSSYHGWTHNIRKLGGTDPPKMALLHIKVTGDLITDDPITVGDGAFIFAFSEDMGGARLGMAEAFLSTVDSGNVIVQIRNITQGFDMLSTRLQIDAGDYHSKDSGTPVVVNAGANYAAFGDLIAIDVDSGSDGLGLGVILGFTH